MMETTQLKAIVIDDEPLARELIQHYLTYHDHIHVVATCSDGFVGAKAIQEYKPDLIFLDIQMPKISGFEMLELIDCTPAIVFTTAFNEFAIKAFEMNAVDYLLKPFSKERFDAALTKVRDQHVVKSQLQFQQVQHDSRMLSGEKLDRIVVKEGPKIHVIPLEEVCYLEAQDDYVMIYTVSGKHLKQQTMKYYEGVLNDAQFVRIHRSYIVNVNYIAQLEHYEKDAYKLQLKNKAVLPVSRSGFTLLKNILKI